VRTRIPLGGSSKDFESRYSREEVINLYKETDDAGTFQRLLRAPGFVDFITLGTGPIRGMHVAADVLYVVSGSGFYRVSVNPVGSVQADLKGTVAGFTGPVRLASIGTDQPQVMALTNRRGFIYDESNDTFGEVTDANFDPDFSVTAFNQRFWFNKPDSNEFFASDILDGFTYDPLFFASAENKPDTLEYVIALNTELYLFGQRTIERWQETGQATGFSVRRITGATINRGIGARASVVQWENNIFFLADDFTVRKIGGGGYEKISDLSFEEQIRDYSFPDRAEAFFLDNPHHKIYCITFPAEGVTWCYDVSTGLWHKRESNDIGRWRISTAELIFDRVILGDYANGNLYVLDENEYSEAGVETPAIWRTPGLSNKDAPFTCSRLEIFPEVGVGTDNNVDEIGQKSNNSLDPEIRLRVSKNGGRTWISKSNRNLGRIGEYVQKVIWRNIGRVNRGQALVFEFSVNDNVKTEIYEGYVDVQKGV